MYKADKSTQTTISEKASRKLFQTQERSHYEGATLDGAGGYATTAAYQDEYVPRWRSHLPERAYLAALKADDSPWTADDLPRWAEGLQALKDLCGGLEPKTNGVEDYSRVQGSLMNGWDHEMTSLDSADMVSDKHGRFPICCLPTQCLFCLGGDRLVAEPRKKQWEPMHVLWRHVRTQHLGGHNIPGHQYNKLKTLNGNLRQQ